MKSKIMFFATILVPILNFIFSFNIRVISDVNLNFIDSNKSLRVYNLENFIIIFSHF